MITFAQNFMLNYLPKYRTVFLDEHNKEYVALGDLFGQWRVYQPPATTRDLDSEFDMWSYAVGNNKSLLDIMENSEIIEPIISAQRARLLFAVGPDRVEELKADMSADILEMSTLALDSLGGEIVSKARPRVLRVGNTRPYAWLEVRAKVRLPFDVEPKLFGVRFFPSPMEDKTWSVHFRHPSKSYPEIQLIQQRFDEFVETMKDRGVIIKDVLNGTQISLS